MKSHIIVLILISIFLSSLFAKEYTLDELYKISLKKDPRLIEFKYSYQLLQNKLDKLDSLFYPKVGYKFYIAPMAEVKGEASGSIDDMNFAGDWGYGLKSTLSAVQPIYTFGKWSTAKDIGKKGIQIAKKKKIKIEQQVKYDLIRAYNALILFKELEKILNDGKSNIKKALKKVKKLEMEDSDDYNEEDLFKLRIYQRKLSNKEGELNSLKEQIRFGIVTLLGIEKDFKIKYKKISQDKLNKKFKLEDMLEYKMLLNLLDINRLNISLKKRYFTPDLFIAAEWYFKYSNVAEKQSGYDPYHANSPGIALGLRWNFDYFLLKANLKRAKIELSRTKARVDYLKDIGKIKDNKLVEELKLLELKLNNLKSISKDSKKWFTGNAMDYYMGLGKAKDLLESLGAYLNSKNDYLRALYNYNLKISEIKLFRGDL